MRPARCQWSMSETLGKETDTGTARPVRTAAATTLLLLVGALAAAPTALAAPFQVTLGDSWSAGYGASAPERGYAPVLWHKLQKRFDCPPVDRDGCAPLKFRNFAIGGATTRTMIDSQYPDALPFIKSRNHDDRRRNDVKVITLTIGGNDIFYPIANVCVRAVDDRCKQTIRSELSDYKQDLDPALHKLRRASGRRALIALGTYDNPIPTCFLAQYFDHPEAFGNAVLEGGDGIVDRGLDDVMRNVARRYDVLVPSSFGKLDADDWLGGGDCLHPDDSGYAKVANVYLRALLD